ncbi:hypothetical protein [Demequina sp. NBRC 110056]|uniref:hypothetical protein n=1 Tax=Demequina sp. NBRC 110056 TaxID=1570345 RepID=UPI00135655C8|nr:hypothetical protein [Demequina sp. NBRC 110056]
MADFTGGPGFGAFVATFAVVVGAIILFRSLSKHLRKVRTHPPEGERPAATASASQTGAVAQSAADTPEAPSEPSPSEPSPAAS